MSTFTISVIYCSFFPTGASYRILAVIKIIFRGFQGLFELFEFFRELSIFIS